MKHPIIPHRHDGAHHDTVSMCCLDKADDAAAHYQLIINRLMAVNKWHSLSSDIKTSFTLCDAAGQAVERPPQVGDHIRIDLPGPGNPRGDGYDWVKIVDVQESRSEAPFYGFTVQPSDNPQSPSGQTAHFFQEQASNTFLVRLLGHCVQAEVHGRNEESNTDTGSLIDRARNQLIALGGKLGLSKIQWQALVEALVSNGH